MSAQEFDSWILYAQEEPWGAGRDNMHAAIIAQLLASAYRRKGTPPPRMQDFMLIGQSQREERRKRGQAALVQMLRMLGANNRRKLD